ncbi:MAG: anaerobic sulfatase-maturation protein [Bacteroidaceae bacterium]
MATVAPYSRPLYVMAKPAGASCNLHCTYCYYLEKKHLSAEGKGVCVMSDDMLETYIRQYIESQRMPEVSFTWHGGEPLMRPLSFYRRALSLQHYYGRGMHIENSIQTNGTLLTDEWCAFFRENNFLVGISIDGPQPVHDAFRRGRRGQPSFRQVMKGIELLQKHGVEWNAMAVVNSINVGQPIEFYRFFKEIGCRYLQFTPVVERTRREGGSMRLAAVDDTEDCQLAAFSVDGPSWGRFLCEVFDQWVRHDVGEIFVQMFDSTLANWMGMTPGLCTLAAECGHAGVLEANGDVYACDHFVFPAYRLGNIRSHTLVEMMYSPRQQAFGRAKHEALPGQCRSCDYLFACHGECPRNRFACTADGEPGLNFLCQGYRRFFSHAAPYMDCMKQLLLQQRPASDVMSIMNRENPLPE